MLHHFITSANTEILPQTTDQDLSHADKAQETDSISCATYTVILIYSCIKACEIILINLDLKCFALKVNSGRENKTDTLLRRNIFLGGKEQAFQIKSDQIKSAYRPLETAAKICDWHEG